MSPENAGKNAADEMRRARESLRATDFVRTGKLDARHLSAFAWSQYDRVSADYGATRRFEAREAEEEIAGARELVEAAAKLLGA